MVTCIHQSRQNCNCLELYDRLFHQFTVELWGLAPSRGIVEPWNISFLRWKLFFCVRMLGLGNLPLQKSEQLQYMQWNSQQRLLNYNPCLGLCNMYVICSVCLIHILIVFRNTEWDFDGEPANSGPQTWRNWKMSIPKVPRKDTTAASSDITKVICNIQSRSSCKQKENGIYPSKKEHKDQQSPSVTVSTGSINLKKRFIRPITRIELMRLPSFAKNLFKRLKTNLNQRSRAFPWI